MIFNFFKIFSIFTVLFVVTACGGNGEGSATKKGDTPAFTVSGTITFEPNSNIDADVMGVNGFQEQNNTSATPQLLSNPVVLGGYLSGDEGSYASGKFYSKDTKDFFRISLLKGQQIRLSTFLADEKLSNINIELFLRPDANLNEDVGSLSFNSAGSQSLTVLQTGVFFIEISAAEDNSSPALYTLSVSQTLSSSSRFQIDKLSANFVPGEVIVKFKDVSSISSSSSSLLKTQASRLTTHDLVHRGKVGKFANVYKIDSAKKSRSLAFESELSDRPALARLNAKWQTLEKIEQLHADSNVLFAEPNFIYEATALSSSAIVPATNDTEYSRQWNLPMLQTPAAWEASTGAGVIVAVIDTGIDANHLDLRNNIRADGYDFISDPSNDNDNEPGRDENPQDTGTFFHGSHVAGIVAAEANNDIGVAGVAYNSSLMPLRVLGIDNTGTNADIANAILYAAGLVNDSGIFPVQKADIINLSLGGPDESIVLEDAINKALEEGVIIIAAAGNESTSNAFYPAAFEGVIGVSSVTDHKTLSTFSNFGTYIDVTAPGGTGLGDSLLDGFQDGVLSTLYASEYVESVGTSMATPHVAAVAALMKSVKPDLGPTLFYNALEAGNLSDDLGNDELFGSGLINAAKAVNWALSEEGQQAIPPSLNIYPTQLGFVGANTVTNLYLANSGSGAVNIEEITASDAWVEVSEFDANSVDDFGLGKYRIRVNNTDLGQNSVNSSDISILYKINNGETQVATIDVFNSNGLQTDSTVGTLWVSLYHMNESLPEQTLTQFALVEARKDQGEYTYRFSNVPKGEYLLNAGTNNDLDNDTFDSGEARGSYPPFTQGTFIQVNDSNLIGLDFGVQYQSFAQSSENTLSTIITRTIISQEKSIGSDSKFR